VELKTFDDSIQEQSLLANSSALTRRYPKKLNSLTKMPVKLHITSNLVGHRAYHIFDVIGDIHGICCNTGQSSPRQPSTIELITVSLTWILEGLPGDQPRHFQIPFSLSSSLCFICPYFT
jgi:hypothetical protein